MLLRHVLGVRLCGIDVCHFTEADRTDGRCGRQHRNCRQYARLSSEAAVKNFTGTGFVRLFHGRMAWHILF